MCTTTTVEARLALTLHADSGEVDWLVTQVSTDGQTGWYSDGIEPTLANAALAGQDSLRHLIGQLTAPLMVSGADKI